MSPDLDSGSWTGCDSSAADVCVHQQDREQHAGLWSPEREQVPPDHL